MAKALATCPVCDGVLNVTELGCARCGTSVHGRFEPCRFCRLSAEHLAFIELFLKCEGNLSRVEKELGLSYPTVRNRLSAALSALGFSTEIPPEPAVEGMSIAQILERRRALLADLAEGRISAEDAAEELKRLSE